LSCNCISDFQQYTDTENIAFSDFWSPYVSVDPFDY